MDPVSFVEAKIEDDKYNAFITAESSVQNIVDIVQNHANNCASKITLKKHIYPGHVALVFNCGGQANSHILTWSSSPYNYAKQRVLLFMVFRKGTQIGFISKRRRNTIETNYHPH